MNQRYFYPFGILFLLMTMLVVPQSSFSQGFTCGQPFTDPRDSNVYNTVLIGNQCWMAENLRYLPAVSKPNQGSYVAPHRYVYGYNGNSVSAAKSHPNYATYGVLYNWYAAVNGDSSTGSWLNPSGVQGVCPVGWHVPSRFEWDDLTAAVGGGLTAGIALKDSGTTHWYNSTGATNSTGFTGLASGRRFGPLGAPGSPGGTFTEITFRAYHWTTSQNNAIIRSYQYQMSNIDNVVSGDWAVWQDGYSVRCVRDAGTITGDEQKQHHSPLSGFPNPVSEDFTFLASEQLLGAPFWVLNGLGQAVISGQVNQASQSVPLSQLPRGIYLLRVGNEAGNILKIVKQ